MVDEREKGWGRNAVDQWHQGSWERGMRREVEPRDQDLWLQLC